MNIGDKLSSFKAFLDDGTEITNDFFNQGKFVLYFYPKDHTPGCTTESCDFRDAYNDFEKYGFKIYGVSKDGIESHKKFIERQSLPFALISDSDGLMCEAFGVWKQKSFMGKKYMGIDRSTFVVVNGVVQKSWHEVKVKNHVHEVLEVVKQI